MTGCSLTRWGKAKNDAPPTKEAQQEMQVVKERKWEMYASDRHMVDYYFDRDNVTYPSRTLVRAWRRRVFPERSPQKEIISFDEIDCSNAKYRHLGTEAVYWNGTTKAFKVVSDWIPVFVNTPDEAFMLDRCKEARQVP
jgi:hypothetical protein